MTELLVGVGISTAVTGGDPVAEASDAERLGYDFVSASDHPVGTAPSYETVALLTWIAARTDTIGIATRVLGVPFRRPALVAKTAESLQRLSGGRLILGLGAGYSDDEIVAVGGESRSGGQKVATLEAAIATMRHAWTGERDENGLVIAPVPDRQIPIWLGTYGPRALAVTGRGADGWIPSLGFAGPDRVPAMLERVRAAAAEAGRGPDAVRPVYNVPVRIDPRGRSDADTVVGSAADIVEQLQVFVGLGFRGFNLQPADGQLEAVGSEVLPALRAVVPIG